MMALRGGPVTCVRDARWRARHALPASGVRLHTCSSHARMARTSHATRTRRATIEVAENCTNRDGTWLVGHALCMDRPQTLVRNPPVRAMMMAISRTRPRALPP